MRTKNIILTVIFLVFISTLGCELQLNTIKKVQDGFQIPKGASLTLILQSPLNSNVNHRGDIFVTKLKEPLKWKDNVLLPQGTEIHGLVKRATKYEKFGDKASLALLFDQLILSVDRRIPLSASLDTENGNNVIKVKGKALKNAKIVGGSTLIGGLVGSAVLKGEDQEAVQKGLLIGAALGTGAVLISNMKEINLPEETEIIIKLEENLFIPEG